MKYGKINEDLSLSPVTEEEWAEVERELSNNLAQPKNKELPVLTSMKALCKILEILNELDKPIRENIVDWISRNKNLIMNKEGE
jgi:hypothetical protein